MSGAGWLVFLAALLVAGGASAWLYLRREAPGRGRPLLAVLRTVAVALVALLFLDPRVGGGGDGDGATAVLLDASLSMAAPGADGSDRWFEAVAAAREAADGGPVLRFGDAVRHGSGDALASALPNETSSRLLPAIKAAAELGARRVVVVTDRGIEDAAEVARWLPRLGLTLEVRDVGGARPAVVVADLEVPVWAEAGEPLEVRWTLAVVHGAPGADSARVVVRAHGRELGAAVVALPEPGRGRSGSLAVTPPVPAGGGDVRLDVSVEGVAGGMAMDTAAARSRYVRVGPRPAGVAIVSLRPDQEPRFLQPALAAALGVPVAAYLRVAAGRWVRTGSGMEVAAAVEEADLRAAVAGARIVVLHGAEATAAPGWLLEAVAAHPRVVVFPGEDGAVPGTPLLAGPALAADWYLADVLPPSPVAPLLVGVEGAAPPPLVALRSATGVPDGSWPPLVVRRGARGSLAPLALVGEEGGRRWVVPLGEGYWRWAFRGGEARAAYRRLWAALGGWLAREAAVPGGEAVRPLRRSVSRGEALAWTAPGRGGDTLRLALLSADGRQVGDTAVTTDAGGGATTAAPAPGHYRYRAVLGADTATGPLTVEPYTPEWVRPAVPVTALEAVGEPLARAAGSAAPRGRPLRASPWPWVAVLALLAAEWTLRRRWGLR